MGSIEVTQQSVPATRQISGDLFDRFISFLDVRPKTVETYKGALRQFFLFLAAKGVTHPTREDILAFREELRKKCKPTTVQLYIIAVRQFFKWTAQEGLFHNVADNVKGAKLDRAHKKDYLTSVQSKEVLDSIEKDTLQGARDYALLALMVTTGLRTIEVARANIEDLRIAGNSAALYIQGKGRDEKTEYVKIDPPVEKAIRSYLKKRGSTEKGHPLFGSLSNNSRLERLAVRSISRIIKIRLKSAGYNSDRLTAHSLRHTAVTLALMKGEELRDVQRFARHASINTTLIYDHSIEMAGNTCSKSVSTAIFGPEA